MDTARALAVKLAKQWRFDPDDIRQEILLWCLQKGIDGDYSRFDSEEEANQQARRDTASMRWAGERWCRKEKAATAGYHPDDEAFYSLRSLQEMLVVYFQVGVVERAPIGASESVRQQRTDGAEYGTYLASLVDVERGLNAIPFHFKRRLSLRFGPLGHLSDDAIASLSQSEIIDLTGTHYTVVREVLGVTGDQVRHRTETALKRLQNALGGPNPYNRGPVAMAV
jgi:hypothetical protein